MDEDEKLLRLAGFIAGVLTQCKDCGMELPFVLRAAAQIDSTFVVLYFEAGPGDKLGCGALEDHMVGLGFECPVNIMIVDQSGEAARITIEQVEPTFYRP